MAKARFVLHGEKTAAAKLRRIAIKYPAKIGAALRLEGELIMTAAKQNHVPVDLGTLRGSGKVSQPSGGKLVGIGKIEVVMSFGDAAAPYALAVHEHPSTHSPPSWQGKTIIFNPEGRGAKYLEYPMKLATKGMASRIARTLDIDRGEM